MFLWFMQPDIWLTLITLTFLEIILGVDNIIFLSLVVAKLPLSQQNMARKLGLSCAMIMRILLLISIAWLSHITQPLFTVLTLEISFRTLILLGGGLFLIYKAIQEIREELSPAQEDEHGSGSRQLSLCGAIVQIMLLDIVFSLDSVITAVGRSAFWGAPRAPMTVAISADGGKSWPWRRNLDEGDGYCMTNNSLEKLNREFSYPSIKQSPDGTLHIAYTWWRQAIKYVRISPEWVKGQAS
ncbi:TPA: hypothetical protein J8L82_003887 [Escherichia coli]|nr:hypothetical protein [Escherichia coli]